MSIERSTYLALYIYTCLQQIFRTLSDKQSATPMESEAFLKCDINEEYLAISHTQLPMSQISPKMENTKYTVCALRIANNDGSHLNFL